MNTSYATAALAEQHRARLAAEADRHRLARATRRGRSERRGRLPLVLRLRRPRPSRRLGQALAPGSGCPAEA